MGEATHAWKGTPSPLQGTCKLSHKSSHRLWRSSLDYASSEVRYLALTAFLPHINSKWQGRVLTLHAPYPRFNPLHPPWSPEPARS